LPILTLVVHDQNAARVIDDLGNPLHLRAS
jgi:hypothetical protein